MKPFFFLGPLFAVLLAAGQGGDRLTFEEGVKTYRSRIPEVYDSHVWNDPAIPWKDWTPMYFIPDSTEIANNPELSPDTKEALFRAITAYLDNDNETAIYICKKLFYQEANDATVIESGFLLGTALLKSNISHHGNEAYFPFRKALDLLQARQERLFEKEGKILCNMGHSSPQKTSSPGFAVDCWEKAAESFKKCGTEYPHPFYNISIIQPWNVPELIDKAQDILSIKENEIPSRERAVCYQSMAWSRWYYGDYESSLHYYRMAVAILKELFGEDHPSLIEPYINIAWSYYYPDHPEEVLIYARKALDLAYRHLSPDDQLIGSIYNVIGLCHKIMGNDDLAIEHFRKRLLMDYENDFNWIIVYTRTLNNLALSYINKKEYDKAISLINKAIVISRKWNENVWSPNVDPDLFGDSWLINLGQAYQQKGEYDEAIKSYKVPLSGFITVGGKCKTHVAGILCEMAMCYEKAENLGQAISYYGEALVSMSCEDSSDVLFGAEYMRNWTFLFALAGKARCHYGLWDQLNHETDLDSAMVLYHRAVTYIDKIQENFRKSGSSFRVSNILSEVQAIYEGAIACMLDKYRMHRRKEDLSAAFELAEKSKALLLLESIRNSNRHHSGNAEWVRQESTLKKEMADIRKDIYKNAHSDDPSDKKNLRALNNDLFDLWQDYEQLIHDVVADTIQDTTIVNDLKVLSLNEVQEQVRRSGNTMIEYFEGYKDIYAFVIKPDTVYVVDIPVDFPIEDWVGDLRTGMYEFFIQRDHLEAGLSQSLKSNYSESAYGIYKKLILPLGYLPEKLVIVPDGILGYIPFEVLVHNPVHQDTPAVGDYLISKHEISYNYSATLWHEMKNKRYDTRGLLALAPEFAATDEIYASVSEVRGEGLGPLFYNDDEVSAIHRMVSGKAIYGVNATADRFRNLSKDYNILHLSTHAKLNDADPDYSFLAFTGSEKEASDDRLYVSELYHMDLPVDMVVLSACETGTGKLQKGEGILSFARAFSFAGAKSVITSLWKANDRSTCEIMTLFYKYLKAGQSKSEALRSAKLAYLAGHKGEELHPFYWATFIPIGDMEAIEVDGGWHWGWGIFILALVVTYLLSLTGQWRSSVPDGTE